MIECVSQTFSLQPSAAESPQGPVILHALENLSCDIVELARTCANFVATTSTVHIIHESTSSNLCNLLT